MVAAATPTATTASSNLLSCCGKHESMNDFKFCMYVGSECSVRFATAYQSIDPNYETEASSEVVVSYVRTFHRMLMISIDYSPNRICTPGCTEFDTHLTMQRREDYAIRLRSHRSTITPRAAGLPTCPSTDAKGGGGGGGGDCCFGGAAMPGRACLAADRSTSAPPLPNHHHTTQTHGHTGRPWRRVPAVAATAGEASAAAARPIRAHTAAAPKPLPQGRPCPAGREGGGGDGA